jgi:hypothetical protein
MKSRLASFIVVLLLCAASASGQTIQYAKLGPSPTGVAGMVTYSGSNPDSVMTVLKATAMIGSDNVFEAWEYGTYQTQPNLLDHYVQSQSVKAAWKQAYSFTKGSGLGALFHYSTTREVVDTGLQVIGIPSGGTFVVTGVIVHGNNDTTGYTSNATVKVGTPDAPTPYANIVSTATPSLGSPGTVTASLVSPRIDVASGKSIYLHVTTAAVATTETITVDVWGYYR